MKCPLLKHCADSQLQEIEMLRKQVSELEDYKRRAEKIKSQVADRRERKNKLKLFAHYKSYRDVPPRLWPDVVGRECSHHKIYKTEVGRNHYHCTRMDTKASKTCSCDFAAAKPGGNIVKLTRQAV